MQSLRHTARRSSASVKRKRSLTIQNVTRRFNLMMLRKETQLLLAIGFLFIVTRYMEMRIVRLFMAAEKEVPNSNRFSTFRITPNDKCNDPDPNTRCYNFLFGTGRSGTKHFQQILVSKPPPASPAFITHELEHFTVRTKLVVSRQYRKLAALTTETAFKDAATNYVTRTKIPFYNNLLDNHKASTFVYTGHIPMVFGLGPALIENLPPGSVRILRVRRDRIATAVSLMALGPESEDPWGATEQLDGAGKLDQAPIENRRWFPTPFDGMVKLRVQSSVWARLNRFQRWLWYVDDVECRWQALRREYDGRFSWMEDSLENLAVFDNGAGWRRVADFLGVDLNLSLAQDRANTIQGKNRTKDDISEATLRQWDQQYRSLVDRCHLNDSVSYGWVG